MNGLDWFAIIGQWYLYYKCIQLLLLTVSLSCFNDALILSGLRGGGSGGSDAAIITGPFVPFNCIAFENDYSNNSSGCLLSIMLFVGTHTQRAQCLVNIIVRSEYPLMWTAKTCMEEQEALLQVIIYYFNIILLLDYHWAIYICSSEHAFGRETYRI